MSKNFLDNMVPIPEYELGILAESPCYLLKGSLVALQQRILWDRTVTTMEEAGDKKIRLFRDVGIFGRCPFLVSVEEVRDGEIEIKEDIEPCKTNGFRTYQLQWKLTEKAPFTQVDLRLKIDWGPKLLRRYSGAITFSQWSAKLELLKNYCERKTQWLKLATPHGRS